MRIGRITKDAHAWEDNLQQPLPVKQEVYEWLGETKGGGYIMEPHIAVTLKPETLPYMWVPESCLVWVGECVHFDVAKAQMDAARKERV